MVLELRFAFAMKRQHTESSPGSTSSVGKRILVGLILLALVGLVPGLSWADDAYRPGPSEWRRTVRGWESTRNWYPASQESASPHPATVAALIGLASLGALIGFNDRR